MKKRQLQECPVCSSKLKIVAYQCPGCRTRIEGSFTPLEGRLASLDVRDLEFVEQFVRVRGSIKEMEKVLGVSYPTVRGMLNAVIEKLGFHDELPKIDPAVKSDILDKLERGEITADRAAVLLKGEENDEDEGA